MLYEVITDHIEFLFAGNKNGEPGAINKVASGGEMSRVMLSIKSLLSAAKDLPTIIFDEIDTGVSGEVADKMGGIMSEMGTNVITSYSIHYTKLYDVARIIFTPKERPLLEISSIS